jgi:hypothetical protein
MFTCVTSALSSRTVSGREYGELTVTGCLPLDGRLECDRHFPTETLTRVRHPLSCSLVLAALQKLLQLPESYHTVNSDD